MNIFTNNPPVTVADVRAFESKHGVRLPPSYVAFIMRHNGGMPSPSFFVSPTDRDVRVNVGLLYGLTREQIDEGIESFPTCVAQGFLPIGDSGGGDVLFLSLQSGAIYLWDHENHDVGTGLDGDELIYLAKNLDDLLAHVEGDEYVVSDVETLGETGNVARVDAYVAEHDIDALDANGWNLARAAAAHGNLPVLRRCIELGASTDGLMWVAAGNEQREVIDYLLDLGLDINAMSPHGRTPLTYVDLDDELRAYMVSRGAVERREQER